MPKLWQKFNEKCDFISVKRQRFRLNGFNAKYWFSIKLKARLNSRIQPSQSLKKKGGGETTEAISVRNSRI